MKKIIALTGLITTSAFANDITISNPNFDAQYLADGVFTSGNVQGWATISGSAGIYNPPEAIFSNESGDGVHANTLYLNGNSVVSQTLNTNLSANTRYDISFDVGDRFDTSMPNYILRVKVAGNTLFNAINPVLPQSDGSFETVNLSFNSGDSGLAGGLITIELEATGNGQVNFDNFAITTTEDTASTGGRSFGEWQYTSYTLNSINQAQTDGFIVYYNFGNCNNNQDVIRLGDTSGVSHYLNRNFGYGGMMTPVKKNQYWKVERYASGPSCYVQISFLPLTS